MRAVNNPSKDSANNFIFSGWILEISSAKLYGGFHPQRDQEKTLPVQSLMRYENTRLNRSVGPDAKHQKGSRLSA